MKKHVIILLFSAAMAWSMALTGCGNAAGFEPQNETESPTVLSGNFEESAAKTDTHVNPTQNDTYVNSVDSAEFTRNTRTTNVVQNGPYGRISIALPEGWEYDLCPVDSERLYTGLYGIQFYPQGVTDGYIEINYSDSFGVCGTGLSENTATIAGNPVNIGTYDNHPYWDFITFLGNCEHIVALTYSVGDWWETYGSQVSDILDTIAFDPSVREGAVYIYSGESELDKISLHFSLKNITPTSATLVFNQYEPDAPTGDLDTGDDYILEVQKNGVWEEAPIVLEGNYGFNAIAYMIAAGDTTELELNWEWLYGSLEAGTYRIEKQIIDFRDTGDFDKYTVFAQFVLN